MGTLANELKEKDGFLYAVCTDRYISNTNASKTTLKASI